MTYNVFGGTLNLAQSNPVSPVRPGQLTTWQLGTGVAVTTVVAATGPAI